MTSTASVQVRGLLATVVGWGERNHESNAEGGIDRSGESERGRADEPATGAPRLRWAVQSRPES